MSRNNRGIAMVMAVVIALMLLILATAVVLLLSGYYTQSVRVINREKARLAAEGGIAEAFRRGFFNAPPLTPGGGNFTFLVPWRYEGTPPTLVESRTVTVEVEDLGGGRYQIDSRCPITQ